jgi:ubiquinone/menaquinone biosynthesis C-methylase UbiE
MRRRDFYLHEYAKPMELDERMEKVLKLISNYKGKVRKFLDIGCGDGSFTLLLKEALGADEVYGVDISPEGCKLAQQKSIKCFCIDIDLTSFMLARF